MQQKNLMILGGVTLAALAVAALTLRDGGTASSAPAAEKLLFPELSARINDVAEVRLEKGGKSATLKKDGAQWRMADRGGYPVQLEKVKELAVRVADLEIVEAKTAKKENHAKLAVEWPVTAAEGEEAADAGLVTLKDAAGKELASVVVGKTEWMGSKPKVYARRAGEDQVYLCAPRGSLDVLPEARGWIDTKIVELANDRVQSVTIEHADGETIEIGRSLENHTQFTVKNLPPGQTERYQGVASGVAQALGYGLALEDVRPVGEVDFTQEPLAKARFRAVDGLELVVETAKFEDKTWARIAASYTPPPEPAVPAAPPEGEGAEGEDAETATPPETPAEEKKDVGKEAAELDARLSQWAFEIPSYKADVLARRMKDLIPEPAPPPGEESLEDLMQSMGEELEYEPLPGTEDGSPVEPAPVPDDEGGAPEDHDHPH
ncbi:MAG TPA: DUF4340 domain-containing protein [Planctomycetota bacterium]